MKKIAVLGGTGFHGSHVVRIARERGFKVYSISRKEGTDLRDLEALTAKFKEIQESYEILSNDDKRKAYDQHGHAGVNQGAAGMGGGMGGMGQGGAGGNFNQSYTNFSDLNSFFEGADMGGVFEQFFGGTVTGAGRGQRVGPRPGTNMRAEMTLTLEEVAFGGEHEISYMRDVKCEHCDGTGSKNKKLKECETCKGQGMVQSVRQTMLGNVSVQSACPDCHGEGKINRITASTLIGSWPMS